MTLYALRGLTMSFSVFVLTYAVTRLAVACGWSVGKRWSARMSPNFLYALQTGPFVLAVVVVVAFTIPSFLRFEPKRVQEAFGAPVLALSVSCGLLLVMGFRRALQAYSRTARMVREWRKSATPVADAQGLPIYETGPEAPPLVVAGLWQPTLLVSSSVAQVLGQEELARAIAHESAHVRRNDNLKKLWLRVASYPRFLEIEQRWLAALEIDADRQAVRNQQEALDLASALVKASRLRAPTAELTTNLTSESGTLLQDRIDRLLAWEAPTASMPGLRYGLGLAAGILAVAVVLSYPSILMAMHSMAERLMR